MFERFSVIAELVSGDPYAQVVGGTVQAGMRTRLSDTLDFDLTAASGLWGEPKLPFFLTAGVRVGF